MHSIYLLAHRRRRREREETISSSTSSSTGAAPLCHTNTLIELVLDVPRNDVPGGDVPGSDIAATAPWEGRAPARPRGAAPLCHTNTHIELILDASESRTSIDPDIMARSTLSPSSVPQQGVRWLFPPAACIPPASACRSKA